jgi:chorismate--pyruvate lyase
MTIKNKQASHADGWLRKPILSGKMQHWLQDHQSLTLRLQQRYQDFRVKPLRVVYAKAFKDEGAILNIPLRCLVLRRDVFLQGGGQTVVFAHSILPRKILRGRWLGLKHLGAKPLGAALFANPQVKRTALRYKKLNHQHPLTKSIKQYMGEAPQALWARRSVFSVHSAQMMVTEIFLPNIHH